MGRSNAGGQSGWYVGQGRGLPSYINAAILVPFSLLDNEVFPHIFHAYPVVFIASYYRVILLLFSFVFFV